MNYKQKALDHVRSVCPELNEPAYDKVQTIVDDLTDRKGLKQEWWGIDEQIRDEIIDEWGKIIGHTPHLEHWLRGMGSGWAVNGVGQMLNDGFDEWGLCGFEYNLTKDGENQSEEYYKAYCEIVGV